MAAAELPETITESNEFTPVWIKRFAIANIAFWIPAGIPSIRIAFAAFLFILTCERRSLHTSFLRKRLVIISVAEIYCEIILAIATPCSARRNPITNIRLRHTFTIPAIKR